MKHSKFLLVFCLILGMAVYFASCEKKYDSEVIYKGTVINTVTQKPFANTEVKVTDGEHINASVKTDENGQFSILVKFNEINGNYYLLIGDAGCVQVKREFKGFGQSEINLGEIEVEGPKAATITTKPVSNITAESAMSGGNITDDGRAEITARGVCWSKAEYPTISDSHTTNGTGKGGYQSEIKGLDGGVTYYVRAYATNSIGTSYGEQFKFATKTGLPVVTTGVVSKVTSTSAVCGGTVTDNAGYQITACGICWSNTTSYPTVESAEGSYTTDIATTGYFNSAIKNLERNTTYYVRAYATNKNGTSYGDVISFTTTTGIPVVNTGTITNITASSAMCGGDITDDGGAEVTARGVCWAKVEFPTISDSHTTNGLGKGAYNSEITGLESGTKYYARAYATNSAGVVYGQQVSFNTYTNIPVVETLEVKEIRTSTAKCGGNVKYDGGGTITACGVCWSSKTSTPTVKDDHTEDFYSVGTYSSILTNLAAKTTYFVRAYATNSNGTSYGESKMFTSGNGMPIVETTPVGENITKESIISGGNVVDDNGFDVTSRGVVWGYVPYPTVGKSTLVDAGDGLGYFSAEIKGVDITDVNAVYIRAFATNSVGTSYGEQVVVSKENYDYATLLTMDFGGYHYKIHYLGQMTWYAADKQCENLVFAGFSDWYLPDYNEVHAFYPIVDKTKIWTSVESYNTDSHYIISNGSMSSSSNGNLWPVYAVRKYRAE